MTARAQRGRVGVAVLSAAAGFACCAFLIVSGEAAASASVVVKPKPGQEITHHPVRFVVRAGPEAEDLKARLNGVRIGRDFLVTRRGRRVLSISNSHGLRHGSNVLKVVARTHRGTVVRRSTVRFTVAHKRPLAGAGRDRRIARGDRIKLKGGVVEHPDGPRGDRVRWTVVRAPRGSRLRRGDAAAKPVSSAGSVGLRSATSTKPTFNPTSTAAIR